MSDLQLCHWLLREPNGKCRSVFAPPGDTFGEYQRVGPAASSSQFVFPMVFAVISDGGIGLCASEELKWRLEFVRDDRSLPGPAFVGASDLKIATLISELSLVIAEWIESVGAKFESIQISDNCDSSIVVAFNACTKEPVRVARCIELIRAGIEMLAVSRGLKIIWS